MNKKDIAVFTVIIIIAIAAIAVIPGFFNENRSFNSKPTVKIIYPEYGSKVSKIVTITGSASDPNGDQTVKQVEIRFNDTWEIVDGTNIWSYTWNIYDLENGRYNISYRAWDGAVYSDIKYFELNVYNSEIVESDDHRWAVFIVAANFPKNNESKLGNGGLYLAEEMASYLIENCSYPTSNIVLLFDDGWIRRQNGFGSRFQTLQQRQHKYDITYAGATLENVQTTLENVVNQANEFDDSEVFVYIASHGCGDNNLPVFGGKVFERSGIFLWDETIITDEDLGDLLINLESRKTCIFVDACYSGGFADKTIYNFPELFLFKSNLAQPGRVVITGTSKYRVGYASTTRGPLFSLLWFEGITKKLADGFKPGLLNSGRPTRLRMFKDGKISVEESFYYAKYMLRNDLTLEDFSKMEPQINDQYPSKGLLKNNDGLLLGQ